MIKRKTKIIIFSIVLVTLMSITIVNNYYVNKYSNGLYVKSLLKEPTQVVYSELTKKDTTTLEVIIPPYASDNVSESVTFYDKDDKEELQKKALIHFEGTYLPSSGILYTSKDPFDVISVLDGEVVNIGNDPILGNTITIKHNNNLITKYYSLYSIDLKKGDKVTQGQILGNSSTSKISPKLNSLLFEVIYQNENINPHYIINQKISNFS